MHFAPFSYILSRASPTTAAEQKKLQTITKKIEDALSRKLIVVEEYPKEYIKTFKLKNVKTEVNKVKAVLQVPFIHKL